GAARRGVVIKDRLALESMRRVDAVFFDKTGTLIKGDPVVNEVEAVTGVNEDTVLTLAAAAEADSERPLANAIVGAADQLGLSIPAASAFSSSTAVGVIAM